MTAKCTKAIAGFAASFAILGGTAFGQEIHTAPQDPNLILTAIYAEMDAAREKTTALVLAKAESDIQMATLRTDALFVYRANLNNRFVLAHLEP